MQVYPTFHLLPLNLSRNIKQSLCKSLGVLISALEFAAASPGCYGLHCPVIALWRFEFRTGTQNGLLATQASPSTVPLPTAQLSLPRPQARPQHGPVNAGPTLNAPPGSQVATISMSLLVPNQQPF